MSKNQVGILIGIAFFAVSYLGIQRLFFKGDGFDNTLVRMANEANKNCPFMVDRETRLDNTTTKPGKVFQYNYTLVHRDRSTVNTAELRNYLIPRIWNNLRTSPDMKIFRDHQVTLVYCYKDKNGNYLTEVKVTPDQSQLADPSADSASQKWSIPQI